MQGLLLYLLIIFITSSYSFASEAPFRKKSHSVISFSSSKECKKQTRKRRNSTPFPLFSEYVKTTGTAYNDQVFEHMLSNLKDNQKSTFVWIEAAKKITEHGTQDQIFQFAQCLRTRMESKKLSEWEINNLIKCFENHADSRNLSSIWVVVLEQCYRFECFDSTDGKLLELPLIDGYRKKFNPSTWDTETIKQMCDLLTITMQTMQSKVFGIGFIQFFFPNLLKRVAVKDATVLVSALGSYMSDIDNYIAREKFEMLIGFLHQKDLKYKNMLAELLVKKHLQYVESNPGRKLQLYVYKGFSNQHHQIYDNKIKGYILAAIERRLSMDNVRTLEKSILEKAIRKMIHYRILDRLSFNGQISEEKIEEMFGCSVPCVFNLLNNEYNSASYWYWRLNRILKKRNRQSQKQLDLFVRSLEANLKHRNMDINELSSYAEFVSGYHHKKLDISKLRSLIILQAEKAGERNLSKKICFCINIDEMRCNPDILNQYVSVF